MAIEYKLDLRFICIFSYLVAGFGVLETPTPPPFSHNITLTYRRTLSVSRTLTFCVYLPWMGLCNSNCSKYQNRLGGWGHDLTLVWRSERPHAELSLLQQTISILMKGRSNFDGAYENILFERLIESIAIGVCISMYSMYFKKTSQN